MLHRISVLLVASVTAWQVHPPLGAVPRAPAAAVRSATASMALDSFVVDRLSSIKGQYVEFGSKMESPDVQQNMEELLQVTKDRAKIEPTVQAYEEYQATEQALADAKEMFAESSDDEEMREMAREEMKGAEARLVELHDRLMRLLWYGLDRYPVEHGWGMAACHMVRHGHHGARSQKGIRRCCRSQ